MKCEICGNILNWKTTTNLKVHKKCYAKRRMGLVEKFSGRLFYVKYCD